MLICRTIVIFVIQLVLCLQVCAQNDKPIRIRVLSYNIHHGAGTDEKLDLPRIAKVIKSVSPDIVALQEVDRGTRRTEHVDQPAELARLTEMKAVFEKNIDYQGGEYGNAVLTKLPIVSSKNHYLPQLREGERRGALEVKVKVDGLDQPLLFIATHFDYRRDDGERIASAKLVNELIEKRLDQPAILAGDLNAVPDSEAIRIVKQKWHDTTEKPLFTFPSDKPSRQIDFILFRPGGRWKTIEVRVLDEAVASDHRPIFSVMAIVGNKNK